MDLEELLRSIQEGEQTSEDRTVYIRDTPNGPRIDFEIIEKTSFEKAYPETIRELRSKGPLPCGHQVDKNNPFGGYCQGRGFLARSVCAQEYCSLCAVQCPRCGIFVSAKCHAGFFDGELFCRRCSRKQKAARALRAGLSILLQPFISETSADD